MHKLLNVSTYVHLEVLNMLICVSVRGSLKFYYTPSREPTVLVNFISESLDYVVYKIIK